MSRLSKREQVIVGAVLLLAVLIGGYLYVLEPRWVEIRDLEQNLIPAREQVLAKARARIAQRETVRSQLAEIEQAVEKLSTRLLSGARPSLAASALQELVKELATETDVEVRSERILQAVERGELLEIPVEVTVSGGIREVINFLYRLERTPKLLALQELKVRVISLGQPRELLTTLTVSGFILSAGGAQTEGEKSSGSPKG